VNVVTELVVANRILANEDVVDAYGHVSVRSPDNPERFFLAHSKSPAMVEAGDIVEHTLDGQAAKPEKRPLYLERFIHAALYEARPDVVAVVHAHAEDVLPFTIARPALKPVIHSGAFIGAEVPVWDIADEFGDETNLLVTNLAQGRGLARKLGNRNVALMRGHGFAAAARSLIDVVRMSVYLPRNARVQLKAMQLAQMGGSLKPLSPGEINARAAGTGYKPDSPETQRAWQYWAQRAGVAHLLTPR
jgi:HCOMODA/2-hydroxy-3-carboxy-muconic semialdehyde decarboxylase